MSSQHITDIAEHNKTKNCFDLQKYINGISVSNSGGVHYLA